jgi:Uma2 family endonuclease
MSTIARPPSDREVIYPDSDGEPMSDNTLQFRWIVTIQGGLDALFADDPNVFVAGDLLWYPVEGDNTIRTAPDAMVAFGRPKGYRGSYMQWREGGIAPQVVFEVTSPGNRLGKMTRKFRFYEKYGVEEYYVYDPDDFELSGWLRKGSDLEEIPTMDGWVSPRTGIRFDLSRGELVIYRPDGGRFLTYVELHHQREQIARQVEQEHRRAEQEHRRAEQLAARLRAMGIDPDAPEEA